MAAVAFAAVVLDGIALAIASGVTSGSVGITVETEFIDPWWYWASLLLCVPLWFFGRRWWRFGPCGVAVAAVTVPQFWAFAVAVGRFEESGFSQGLEFLGVIAPIFFSLCFAVATGLGAAFSPARRESNRKHDHSAAG